MCVETEKYAHVTFFFNGGREEPFEGEERVLIPSPKVPTYDLKPAMSVNEVADAICSAISKKTYHFILANLAPPDMVGHTGNYKATIFAVEATDSAIQKVYSACLQHNYILIVTADHGNAEKMSHDGKPHTAHTCAKVPLIVARKEEVAMGVKNRCKSLCDVAPLILDLMEISVPCEITGSSPK
jgi:2,3-bisphosphoglycerate-independent phosphoglycerate mutase